ncbi:MFS transporter [Streptomyces sp. LN549]|uniref:MFS transporter n=1 Tax=Streptomyces sp. LN549 TaxID=3112979 RepID=UPI003713AFE9
MSSSTAPSGQSGTATAHRGAILTVILCVQLLSAIDITVMNMALPKIQHSLDVSPTALSWVLNAYTLAYGGFLLLGGRMGDILGSRKALMTGVALFTVASFAGGCAQETWWLLTARVFQGLGAALALPSTMALIVRTFTGQEERTKALGISVMASGIGSTGGLLLGGVLTDLASWRWVLFINVPIGIAVLALTPRLIARAEPQGGRFDGGGALLGTAGMSAVVYGFVHAADEGWSNTVTVGSFVLGFVLLCLLVRVESRHAQPILNLGLFTNRNRAGGFLVFVCSGGAMFGMFFFLTQFVQNVLDMNPIQAGLAFLPMSLGMIVVPRTLTPRLVKRYSPKTSMVTGLIMVAAGMVWLTRISASTGYFSGIMVPMLLAGAGVGLLNSPLAATILADVPPKEAGGASGALQTVGMIGGSIGTAVLVTVFGSAIRSHGGTATKSVLADSIATTCFGGLAFAVVGLLLVLLVIRTKKPGPAQQVTPQAARAA